MPSQLMHYSTRLCRCMLELWKREWCLHVFFFIFYSLYFFAIDQLSTTCALYIYWWSFNEELHWHFIRLIFCHTHMEGLLFEFNCVDECFPQQLCIVVAKKQEWNIFKTKISISNCTITGTIYNFHLNFSAAVWAQHLFNPNHLPGKFQRHP